MGDLQVFIELQVWIRLTTRPLANAAGLLVWLAASAAIAQDEPASSYVHWGVDVVFIDSSGHPSWLEGSGGKLRFDPDNDGLKFSRAFIDYRTRLATTLNGHVVSEIYDDDFGPAVDLTEAYLEWRPLTAIANRYRLKVGAFYPRISLENMAPGWGSNYSINPSAINTWVGEELRSVGAELSISRRPESLGGAHTFTLNAAVFEGNDPAGGLIAWKGWSIHDRQSRLNDQVPLPPIPRIQPGNWFDGQDPFITPLLEIDEEPGYYVNVEWRYANRLLLRAMRYDNQADPMGHEDRQFAWWTWFDHVAVQATLPGDIGLLAQWMSGWTAWGLLNDEGIYSVDTDFESTYLLLTRAFDRHRITARYDHFELTENDSTPLDENSERGHAWMLAYQFEATNKATVALEWLQIFTERPAWGYFNLSQRKTESQLQIVLQVRFDHSF